MFAQVDLAVSARAPVLTVPVSAVIDSGTRQVVLVQAAEGKFEPREVRLGERSDNYVTVLEGVKTGELVVVAANFLIDAESNLKAAFGSFGSAQNSSAAPVNQASDAPKAGASIGHKAQGKVESVDAKGLSVSLTHGPVASLKWPGMTMDFRLANSALLKELKTGSRVEVEFVERGAGEWVITTVKPAAAGSR